MTNDSSDERKTSFALYGNVSGFFTSAAIFKDKLRFYFSCGRFFPPYSAHNRPTQKEKSMWLLLLFAVITISLYFVYFYVLQPSKTEQSTSSLLKIELQGSRYELKSNPAVYVEVEDTCNNGQHWSRCESDEHLGKKRDHTALKALFMERQLEVPSHFH